MFDIIIPVYNNLHHLRPCLESLEKNMPDNSTLIIVDDASDEHISEEIKEILKKFGFKTLYIRNKENIGYLKSCNKGIMLGDNPYVVLVNSDTLIYNNTFKILEETFDSDPNIGVINPVSNWANWTRIPFPEGFSINELKEFISSFKAPELIVDINNASGFFLAVKRELFDKYGLYDEIYSPKYFEVTDFCMRILEQGYRIVVNKSLFVFIMGGEFLVKIKEI